MKYHTIRSEKSKIHSILARGANQMGLTKVYTLDLTEDSVWLINTPSSTAMSSLFYAQEAGLFSKVKKLYAEYEGIASYLLISTLSGECQYYYNGKHYVLEKDCLVWADCMEFHKISVRPDTVWSTYGIHFSGPNSNAYYDLFKSRPNCSPLIRMDCKDINKDISNIISLHDNRSMYSELICSQIITKMLTDILLESKAIIPASLSAPQYINDAISDIDAHLHDELSLDYFSEKLSISKFYFVREFKKYTGFTPNQYIIMTRINHAKKLLLTSEKSVSSIAVESGFCNIGHFINMFKKYVNKTPLQFRKSKTIR